MFRLITLKAMRLALTILLICVLASPAWAAEADEAAYQLTLQGRQARAAGNLPLALSIFQRALTIMPTDTRAYFWVAVCQDEMGHPQDALETYERCIGSAKEHGMDSAEMRIDLGNLLCRMRFYKQAVFDYKRALEIDPRMIIAHLYLARALIELGYWSQAMLELNACTILGVSDPSISFLKALCLKEQGNYADALQEMEHFFSTTSDAIKASTLGQQAGILQLQLQKNLLQP